MWQVKWLRFRPRFEVRLERDCHWDQGMVLDTIDCHWGQVIVLDTSDCHGGQVIVLDTTDSLTIFLHLAKNNHVYHHRAMTKIKK